MAVLCADTQAQDRTQARSMVISRYGIVATEHPIASQIGATILSEGGNAVDAAVAANAAMGVLAPMANGIGGDLFAIVYEQKSGRLYGLNASASCERTRRPQKSTCRLAVRRSPAKCFATRIWRGPSNKSVPMGGMPFTRARLPNVFWQVRKRRVEP